MTRFAIALAVLAMLGACGVDGAPERPKTGVNVTGDAQLGVVLN